MTARTASPHDANDLRAGGSWTLAQRSKNDALWALSSIALAAVRRLSASTVRSLGRGLGAVVHAFASQLRRTAEANVRLVLPELEPREQEQLVRRCFLTLGELLGETVAALGAGGGPPLLEVTAEARAVLEGARRQGRGVVFPSAHLGPWERVAASLVAAGIPLVTLARESYDPRFSALYERLRGGSGVGVVWRASPGAAARILRTLRAGGVLGMPMDLRSRGVATCDAELLGRPTPTPAGPARLALRTGAPVVVGTAAPGPRAGLEGAPQAPWIVTATRIPTDGLRSDDEGVLELTRRINAELSRRILAAPHAWVWMHDRWPTPAGPRQPPAKRDPRKRDRTGV